MKKAFTLLELVIVIIIIGVLASLALPRMFRVIEGTKAAEAVGDDFCYTCFNGALLFDE